jgi:aminopeptidase N
VHNLRPVVAERGVNADPTEDQYFKGALMLNTLRSVIDNDAKWFALIRGFYQQFKYQDILTEDVVAYFNQHAGMNLTPIFKQYLRHAAIPGLEVLFGEAPGVVMYKWNADEDNFAMPVRVGTPGHWQLIRPTTQWQTMKWDWTKEDFQVDLDHYYVELNKQ